MTKPIAQCGTDGGYYRHLRRTKTEPCTPCRKAHAERKRQLEKEPFGNCPCGTKLRTEHEHCSRCRRKLDRAEAKQPRDDEDTPKVLVAWVRRGAILRPVFAEEAAA